MSSYFVKRNGYTKVQGPYTVARLKRYVEQQRLWMNDEISKDGVVWKKAGEIQSLFPLFLEAEDMTMTLSGEPHPRRDYSAQKSASATATTLIDESVDLYLIQNQKLQLMEDEAFDSKLKAERQASYVMLCTIFIFGISFGFGLFMTLSSWIS